MREHKGIEMTIATKKTWYLELSGSAGDKAKAYVANMPVGYAGRNASKRFSVLAHTASGALRMAAKFSSGKQSDFVVTGA